VNSLVSRFQFFVFVALLFASASACAKDAAIKSGGPTILLANVLRDDIDVAQYLVSEKYDGVRAIWDGRVLRFRSGRVVNAPQWFTAKLPLQSLDGELWLGRDKFEQLSGIVRKNDPVDAQWRQLKYMVFELPDAPGTFAERAQRIREIVEAAKFPQLVAVTQTPIISRAELEKKFAEIVNDRAEGLMLHLAEAPYSTGRSDVLLKLKPLLDTEAKVVEHVPGKGKYKNMMGALRVQMPDGRRFNIGTGFTDSVRKNPPPVGATITYTYPSLTKTGLPRFAAFLRVRENF
jgi:DNA ligase 1